MELGILLGLFGIISVIALFLMYFISSAMDSRDASRVDEVPQNNFNQK